jgi:uncharacterized membrane protein YqjE
VDERAPATDTEAMGGESHVGAIRGLLSAALDTLRTRLDLAAVELELYLLRIVRMLLWAAAAVACALFALVFGLVSMVVALWDTHRMLALLSGTGLFVILAAVFGALSARTLRNRSGLLEGTLAQLEHDQRSAKGVP